MNRRRNYQYYVEGDDEKSLLDVMKRDFQCIVSGKVDKFNVIQNRFSIARIRPLKQDTVVVLVYDTDVEKTDNLRWNVEFLKKQNAIKDVICIPQVRNLEDELKYACNIRDIGILTHSSTRSDYKRDLISCTNLGARLKKCSFDSSKFWSQIPVGEFKVFGNDAGKIKL